MSEIKVGDRYLWLHNGVPKTMDIVTEVCGVRVFYDEHWLYENGRDIGDEEIHSFLNDRVKIPKGGLLEYLYGVNQ